MICLKGIYHFIFSEGAPDLPPSIYPRSRQPGLERSASPHLTATPPHSPARYPTPPQGNHTPPPHTTFQPVSQDYGHHVAPQNYSPQVAPPQNFVYNSPEPIRQEYDTIPEQTYQEIGEPNFYNHIPEENCSNIAEPSDMDSEGSDHRYNDLPNITQDCYPHPHFAPDDISEDSYNLPVSEDSYNPHLHMNGDIESMTQSEVGDSGDSDDDLDILPPDMPRIHQYSPSQLK